MSRPYESLNDAAEATGIQGLRPGKTEIRRRPCGT
jgi:hypothetical protein